MSDFFDFILAHWPFFAFTFACMIVVQTAKATIWTEAHAKGSSKKAHFYWWGRKTMALQCLLSGALFGLIPNIPISDGFNDGIAAKMLYYGAAGILAAFSFDVLKGLAKRKGYDIAIPGLETQQSNFGDDIATPKETPIPVRYAEPPSFDDESGK